MSCAPRHTTSWIPSERGIVLCQRKGSNWKKLHQGVADATPVIYRRRPVSGAVLSGEPADPYSESLHPLGLWHELIDAHCNAKKRPRLWLACEAIEGHYFGGELEKDSHSSGDGVLPRN